MPKSKHRRKPGGKAAIQRRDNPEQADGLPAAIVRRLVDMANANDEHMDGTTAPVLEIVAASDLVFGVWQDPAEPYGVGLLIIKGTNRLREIVAGSRGQELRMSAIKCVELEHAEALRLHVATDPTH